MACIWTGRVPAIDIYIAIYINLTCMRMQFIGIYIYMHVYASIPNSQEWLVRCRRCS